MLATNKVAAAENRFRLKYMLASCMYGTTSLAEILPEAPRVGASAIDIWPKPHGSQREELDELGEQRFAELLKQNKVKLGCITQYKLGPFALQNEMRLAKRFGCQTIVTGGVGPKGLAGNELKQAVAQFVEKLKPHVAVARENDVTIAIENHSNNVISSPDSMKWLIELAPENIGIAFAPYHLPQDSEVLGKLVRDLGNRIRIFYAWQHGKGCMKKLPKDDEMLQLPGLGSLDFSPMIEGLQSFNYSGWTEVFMHPVPRGVPILETPNDVTLAIERAKQYLDHLVLE